MALKHIGRLEKTGRKVAVAFRTLPDDPNSCLVVQTENLGDSEHDVLMNLVESNTGQNAEELHPSLSAKLTVNLSSQAGREDWIPIKLIKDDDVFLAEPIFGKSNLIFTLVAADGLLKISSDATGLSAGEIVDVILI